MSNINKDAQKAEESATAIGRALHERQIDGFIFSVIDGIPNEEGKMGAMTTYATNCDGLAIKTAGYRLAQMAPDDARDLVLGIMAGWSANQNAA